jgi:hypothetical protein
MLSERLRIKKRKPDDNSSFHPGAHRRPRVSTCSKKSIRLEAYLLLSNSRRLRSLKLSSISNFVEQLLAAELFFAVGFLIFFAFVGVCYLLGAVGERGWALMKQEAQKHSAHLHGQLPLVRAASRTEGENPLKSTS